MLSPDKKTILKDATFGEFQLIEYDAIDRRLPIMNFFLDLWREKGGEDKAITRADINPLEMKKYLEHIVLMDVVQDEQDWHLIVRLIGGHVSNFYGEITGKDVREMGNTQAIERIYYAARHIIDTDVPMLTISPAYSADRSFMEAVALYLPLFDNDENVVKILVAVNVSSISQAKLNAPS